MEKVKANYGITNLYGIMITGIEHGIDDYIYYHHANGNNIGKLNRSKIRYTAKGRAYFVTLGMKVYLDEVIVE